MTRSATFTPDAVAGRIFVDRDGVPFTADTGYGVQRSDGAWLSLDGRSVSTWSDTGTVCAVVVMEAWKVALHDWVAEARVA